MSKKLEGKKIAILATNGFEHDELFEPKKALEEAGAVTHVVSLESGSIKSWQQDNWGETIAVDVKLANAQPSDYDGLMLPGGVMNPDKLRARPDAVDFVAAFMREGKPVAAICHGPWTLIETGMIDGRKMTSYSSIKTDLKNAGADWVDEEVVVDNGLVTSRKPADIPAFNKKMIEEFAEGRHNPA
jgi:protease I